MKISTAADLRAFIKGFYDQHVTALNGILEKVPEGLKGEFTSLRDGLAAQLEKLPSADGTEAAAFPAFAEAWARLAEYTNGLRDRMGALTAKLTDQATALNGLQEQIAAGAYLTKEKATEACAVARSEGAAGVRVELLATRKEALELCGLPVPGETILGLPGSEYSGRLAGAKEQVAKLKAKGLTVGGKGGAWVSSMAWLGATEFNGQMTALEEVIGKAEIGKAESRKADPLLGASGEVEKAKGPAIALV